jgi:tRNA 2-thiouridine synthesizing protein A
MNDQTTLLDATGLRCPLPVLRARKILKGVPAGGVLKILATDTAAPADFEAFCRETGHALIDIAHAGDVYTIRLRKAASGR